MIHRAGQPMGEWVQRVIQREVARRAVERGDLRHAVGGQGADRTVATPLQHGPAAQLAGAPPPRTGVDCVPSPASKYLAVGAKLLFLESKARCPLSMS